MYSCIASANIGQGASAPDLSIVIPAFNEVDNIRPLVSELRAVFEQRGDLPRSSCEIIVVDDGSTDGTDTVLRQLVSEGLIRFIRHDTNKGYGAALRSGFSEAGGRFVAFIDGDRQLYPEDLLMLYRRAGEKKIVAGYREHRSDPLHRVVLGKLFSRVFVPLLIGVDMRDVDCALKVLPRELLRRAELSTAGALINSELLARGLQLGYRIEEHPVRHKRREHGTQSGAKLRVIARVFAELWGLRRKLFETAWKEAAQSGSETASMPLLGGAAR